MRCLDRNGCVQDSGVHDASTCAVQPQRGQSMVIGEESTAEPLSEDRVRDVLDRALRPLSLDSRRVLVIIPDGTRTAPIPLLFRLLYEQIGQRVARLDYLIALGTHPPMPGEAIDHLVGVPAAERAERYPNVEVFNHRWNVPEALQRI